MAWQQVSRRFVRESRPGASPFWFRETGTGTGELIYWLDGAGRPVEIHLSRDRWPGGREEFLEWRSGGRLRVGTVDPGESVRGGGPRYKMSPLLHFSSRTGGRTLTRLLEYFEDRAEALRPDQRDAVGGLLRSESLKLLARRFVDDVLNGVDPEAAGLLLAPDFVDHVEGLSGGPPDPTGLSAAPRVAFPDLRHEIGLLIVEDDRAALHLTVRAMHQGDVAGRPSTGRPVSWSEIQILRLGRGRIAERWVSWDRAGLLRQIEP